MSQDDFLMISPIDPFKIFEPYHNLLIDDSWLHNFLADLGLIH